MSIHTKDKDPSNEISDSNKHEAYTYHTYKKGTTWMLRVDFKQPKRSKIKRTQYTGYVSQKAAALDILRHKQFVISRISNNDEFENMIQEPTDLTLKRKRKAESFIPNKVTLSKKGHTGNALRQHKRGIH